LDGIRINTVTIAILVIALVMTPVAYAEYDSIVVNTSERTWILAGWISFTVAEGTTTVSGVEIGPGDVVTVQYENVVSSEGETKIWIGLDGWVNIEAEAEGAILIVNGVEVASGVWELENIRADLASIESTLTLTVPSEDPGWTHVEIEGETIIRGESSDEIIVSGIKPSATTALNFNMDSQFLRSGAESVEINGQEVPLVSAKGLALLALLALAGLVLAGLRR